MDRVPAPDAPLTKNSETLQRAPVYTESVTHSARHARLALLLSLTVGGAPVMLDYCATLCRLARTPVSASAAPSCHHHVAPTPGIGGAAAACSHDLGGAILAAIESRSAKILPALSDAVAGASIALLPTPHSVVFVVDSKHEPPDRQSRARFSPLRI